MSEPEQSAERPLTDAEKHALIEAFEANGYATFIIGVERQGFEVITEYVRENSIPTFTDIDRETGTITITKRPMGSLEFGLI